MAALLEVENVSVAYGPIAALTSVSIEVPVGAVTALLGPNGAGKSSLLGAISGLTRAHGGRIVGGTVRLDGRPIERTAPHRIAGLGIAHVPEGRRVITPLTVEENLTLAGAAAGGLRRGELSARVTEMFEAFPHLGERRKQQSSSLSGGEQQMLALARAMITGPTCLLLDEPSMGLAPIVIEEVYRMLATSSELTSGMAVLLAEQSTAMALDIASRAYVLVKGSLVFEGRAEELVGNDRLTQAYLSGSATA